MTTKTAFDSSLANVASEINERRCSLIGRHQKLKNNVATLERSIPALMAYSMWMTEQDCRNGPYDKIRDLVNRFSPQPDPADRLLGELKNAVDSLHKETAQLHDKIIDADIKLEETDMELESLEVVNKEMEKKMEGLRKEIQKYSTPSLHSIHSEDLICLRKIRQFAEDELKLKNSIRELQNKEFMYRRQMNELLSCKKFGNRKTTGRMQDSKGAKNLFNPSEDYTHATNKKCILENKKRNVCCSCATAFKKKPLKKQLKTYEESCPPFSCCVPLDYHKSHVTANKSRDCICCESCRGKSSTVSKSKSSAKPFCEYLYNIMSKTDGSPPLKQLIKSSVPCNPSETCNECTTPAACKQINICEYDCEKRCGSLIGLSDDNVKSLYKTQSILSKSEIDYSSSDEEFCECCTCGCEINDNLLI